MNTWREEGVESYTRDTEEAKGGVKHNLESSRKKGIKIANICRVLTTRQTHF